MTTTTTTAYADEFIANFDRYAPHPRSDGIVQTRLGGKSISTSFTDYILQVNTKDHTALVYSIPAKSVTMKLQVLGEGPSVFFCLATVSSKHTSDARSIRCPACTPLGQCLI